MKVLLIIFFGGGAGSVTRYLLINYFNKVIPSTVPYGVMLVNLFGALIIGIIYYLITTKLLLNEQLKIFLTIGFLGGFTTFSTFNLDFFKLIESGNLSLAIIYAIATLIGTITLFYMGYSFAKLIS
ncbi:MAG: fluoride efflux transporter CrcB [Pelagibacterales bacterium]|nr:fluoride efflux transporter CrcB [Pelagibacterales bacterium]MBL6861519.1 fluoride efflux transporter CrcB [Pelagibacterales bacterium]